ncbi:MAG TPA: GNAT family N-acetyltransferase [Microthrixaceae bacterium]|nr:GNAT family N-acetyltransferase [Microthrixaceae bacterium]
MNGLTIRPYRASDLADVRRICFETGHMGEPIAWQYRDPASFAYLFCDWHLEHHPDTAWVVDRDGRAVGYLLGSADTYVAPRPEGGRTYVQHEAGYMTRHVLRRGLLVRPGTAGWFWRMMIDLARDRRVAQARVDRRRYPADLHIDLLPEARGNGIGRRLMMTWFDRLAELGVSGVHLGTWGENAGAIAFFESMGFESVGEAVPSPGFRLRDGKRTTVRWMTREITPTDAGR